MTLVLEEITQDTWFDRLIDGTLSFDELPVKQGERIRATFLGNDPSSDVDEEPRIHCLLTPFGKRLESWGDDDSWLYLVVGPKTLFAYHVDEGKLHKKGSPAYILSEERTNHRTKKRILPYEAPSGFPEKIISDTLFNSVRKDVESEWRLQFLNRYHGTLFVRRLYSLLDRGKLPDDEKTKGIAIQYFSTLYTALNSRTRIYDTMHDLFCDDFDSTRPVRRRSLQGLDMVRPILAIENDRFSNLLSQSFEDICNYYFGYAGARFHEMPNFDLITDDAQFTVAAKELYPHDDSVKNTLKRRLSMHGFTSSLFRASVNFTALCIPSGIASLIYGHDHLSSQVLETAALAAVGADTGIQFLNGLWSYARWGVAYTPGIPATLREMRSPDNIYRQDQRSTN